MLYNQSKETNETQVTFGGLRKPTFLDILASYRVNNHLSQICRRATNSKHKPGYRIDLLEKTPAGRVSIYAIGTCEYEEIIRASIYPVLGQILFYSTMIKKRHDRRILMVTDFKYDPLKSAHIQSFVDYVDKNMGVKINIAYWEDLTKEMSIKQVLVDDTNLRKELLGA